MELTARRETRLPRFENLPERHALYAPIRRCVHSKAFRYPLVEFGNGSLITDVAQRKHFAEKTGVGYIRPGAVWIEAALARVQAVDNEIGNKSEAVGDIRGCRHDVRADDRCAAVELFGGA